MAEPSEVLERAAPAAAAAPKGTELIRDLLPRLPNEPGVYRMLDERGEPLYVGKAKSLRKRVASYAKAQGLPARIQRMVALTRSMGSSPRAARSRRCCSRRT
jgi:excinuclease ABC subunit C